MWSQIEIKAQSAIREEQLSHVFVACLCLQAFERKMAQSLQSGTSVFCVSHWGARLTHIPPCALICDLKINTNISLENKSVSGSPINYINPPLLL